MRKSILIFTVLFGLFFTASFWPAEAKIFVEPNIPAKEVFADISDLVTADTFTTDNDGFVRWRYDFRRFSGDLPPAKSYTVTRFQPLSFGFSSQQEEYLVIFWDNFCGIKTKENGCIKITIRLSTSVIRTQEQLKTYINGLSLENARLIFRWTEANTYNKQQEYEIVIFPDGY